MLVLGQQHSLGMYIVVRDGILISPECAQMNAFRKKVRMIVFM